jgi:hypothetical protein
VFACKGQKLMRMWLDSGVLFLGSVLMALFRCATVTSGSIPTGGLILGGCRT